MLEIIQPFDTLTLHSRSTAKLKCERPPSPDRMPVDFASYLLSSSPPAFELNYSLRDHFGMGLHQPRARQIKTARSVNAVRPVHKTESLPDLRDRAVVQEEETASHSDEDIFEIESSEEPEAPRPATNGMGKKRVTFADDCGKNLVSVRLLTESSNTPPNIRPQILNSLTQGCSAAVTEASPLMLNFAQPASNYLAFREKIEKDCVSLENVIIKDYSLIGTIKVKNLSFEKSVHVRCTFNSWETSQDFDTKFVPNGQNVFDTFAFEIRVPPTFDVRKKVQFCICYRVNNTEYWDSNQGNNYEAVSADWKLQQKTSTQNTTVQAVYNLQADSVWSQFSGWDQMDSSCPYW